MYNFWAIFIVLNLVSSSLQLLQIHRDRKDHVPNQLNRKQLQYISNLSDNQDFVDTLDNILIPRVVSTPNHKKVRDYIVKRLKNLGWDVKVKTFVEKTPNLGQLTFSNIVGTLNPNADRFLVLACHYDSKYFKNKDFLGATDSAVPCSMMLNLAHSMQKELKSIKDEKVSLKLFFLDGEEAFQSWSPTDSLYGARNLAYSLSAQKTKTSTGEEITELDKIDVFCLLDLIGGPNPKFYSFFQQTNSLHGLLVNIEQRMAKNGLLVTNGGRHIPYFQNQILPSQIEDDHIPFMKRGVPILHVIATPFPTVWHKMSDNRENLDPISIENLNKIFRAFVAEYLHCEVSEAVQEEEERHAEL